MCKIQNRNSIELADILRSHKEQYCQENTLTMQQHKALNAICNCRTSELGGHIEVCDECAAIIQSYNSCRNRHCPKCQALATAKWLEDRRNELLPVEYFHVVFTLPHELNLLASYNQKLLYNILFQAAWTAISKLGKDPKRLDGEMGMLSILHTWGQNLMNHIHLHCVVPGGALREDGTWKSSSSGFLFPVKVLSKIFRGTYINLLRKAYEEDKLILKGAVENLKNPLTFTTLLDDLMAVDWVVYCKEPFAGPERVLDYLGRYTHKIAISNNRIISYDDNTVTFKWRDYADNNRVKVMTLDVNEFIRRFLMHIVPNGFMRIRFFGFLGNACKKKKINIICQALNCFNNIEKIKLDIKAWMLKLTGVDITLCPICGRGRLCKTKKLPTFYQLNFLDTS